MRVAKAILVAILMAGALGVSYFAFCGVLIWSGNRHTVAEGQLYRSAQLSGPGFAEEIDAHHIRSVLNLRGPHPAAKWYQDEVAAAHAHGAVHYDVGMSAQGAGRK